MNTREYLTRCLDRLSVTVSDNEINELFMYMDMTLEKNKVMNLTAITNKYEFIMKHFIDSLSVMTIPYFEQAEKIIDVGTGAGFPGIPLKIINKDKKFVLMDSLNKRLIFLNEVISALKLDGIKTIHSRAEELGRNPEHREKYCLACSRAVARLSILAEYCLPFVKVGGVFLSMKGPDIKDELAEAGKIISLLGGEIEDVSEVILPDMGEIITEEIKHTIVIVRKLRHTSAKYPRNHHILAKKAIK